MSDHASQAVCPYCFGNQGPVGYVIKGISMPAEPQTAIQMLNSLIQQGYIAPAENRPFFEIPTAYRTVPTMTASGTGTPQRASQNAELERSPEGNSQDTSDAG
jgi:hypothetical protein